MTRDDLMAAYPMAFEDDHGTIWISQQCADYADWTYEHGDAFLGDIRLVGEDRIDDRGRDGDVP